MDGLAKRLVRRHSWGGPLQMPEGELPPVLQAPAATSMVRIPFKTASSFAYQQVPFRKVVQRWASRHIHGEPQLT